MMIDVQISPTHPVVFRHLREERMAAPLEIAFSRGYAFNHRRERILITLKILRWRAPAFLIILRHGGHAVWPFERRVQGDPSHQAARQEITLVAGNLPLAHDRLK